jgi:hypothetical protein
MITDSEESNTLSDDPQSESSSDSDARQGSAEITVVTDDSDDKQSDDSDASEEGDTGSISADVVVYGGVKQSDSERTPIKKQTQELVSSPDDDEDDSDGVRIPHQPVFETEVVADDDYTVRAGDVEVRHLEPLFDKAIDHNADGRDDVHPEPRDIVVESLDGVIKPVTSFARHQPVDTHP